MARILGIALVLAIGMVFASGAAVAGDSNRTAAGDISASDANQGSGSQTNADDWEDMDHALAGSGNQAGDIEEQANTGSGVQDNASSDAAEWEEIVNANGGSGAQVLDARNSNGRDRNSNDVVLDLGSHATLANAALDSQVTGNVVRLSGSEGGSVNSAVALSSSSGFSSMFGVSAVGISGGANASQNVSVDVTASVAVGN